MVSAATLLSLAWTVLAKTLVSDEAIAPDIMDAKEGSLSCPHLFTGAGGIWAMAQTFEECQSRQPRSRRQSWLGISCMAVAAHSRGVCGLGVTREPGGACGHTGDRKESREDLGHHLVASLTAFPKSLSHRVIIALAKG